MSTAKTLYKKYWLDTKQTAVERQIVRNACIVMAEKIEINGNEGFQFPDNSKLIFTSDNIQVSLF